jgi:hypothetical protein
MKFKGHIIITDPCYIIRDDSDEDWGKCEYGSKMEKLGITTYLTRGTGYGDWSCTTLEKGTGKPIGNFCADAGLVSIFLLDEVLKYNPDFNNHTERKFTTTLIEDFDGDIIITHRDFAYTDEDDEIVHGREVSVIGNGTIDFFTSQTGF